MTGYVTLEFIGEKGPFENIEAYVATIKRQRTSISDRDIDRVIADRLLHRRPRLKGQVVIFWGADVLSADVTSIDAWDRLSRAGRRILRETPIAGRQALLAETDVKELSKTYAWRVETTWIERVTVEDVERIRASFARRWFRNPERADGPYRQPRAYGHDHVIDQQKFAHHGQMIDYLNDQERVPLWSGV